VSEQPYLVDSQADVPRGKTSSTNDDNSVTATTSANVAAKPARSSTSLLHRNNNEMTTTATNDNGTKPTEPATSHRTNDGKMTTLSTHTSSKSAESIASRSCNGDGKVMPTSNDIGMPKPDKSSTSTSYTDVTAVSAVQPQTTPMINQAKNNTDGPKDGGHKAQNIDVGRLDTKSPADTALAVDGDNQSMRQRMNLSELKEDRVDKSLSLCNQPLKVSADLIMLKFKLQKNMSTLRVHLYIVNFCLI